MTYTADGSQARREINNITNSVQKMDKEAEQAGNSLKEMFRQTAAFAGVSLGVAGLKQFATEMFNVRKQMQGFQISFNTLLGDEKKAAAMFGELKQFAATTPLMLKDLASGAQTMLGFNIEAEKVVPTLKAIGDISMGDSQKFQSLTLAFSQMSATGKLMGQDLLQMINAGFNPLAQMSITTGKSISQLKDEMSQGAISAEMVTQAFIDATSEGGKYFGMLEEQGKGLAGQYNQLQGAIDDMFNDLGEKATPIIVETMQGLTSLAQNYEKVGKVIVSLISTYGTYKAAVMTVTTVERFATTGTTALTVAQALLNKTMLANPFVLCTSLLIGFATAMWATSDATTTAEKGANAYNKRLKEQQENDRKLAEEVERYLGILQDVNEGDFERQKALDALKEQYPELLKDYDLEKLKLEDILTIKKQIADIDNARRGKMVRDTITDIDAEIRKLESNAKYSPLSAGDTQKLGVLREERKQAQRELSKQTAEEFTKSLENVDEATIDKYVAELERRVKGKKGSDEISLRLPGADGALGDEAIFKISEVRSLIELTKTKKDKTQQKSTTYKEDAAKAMSDWKDAKKEYERIEASQTSTSKEVQEAKAKMDAADKAYEELTGTKASALSKSNAKDAQSEIQAREQALKNKKDADRAEIDAEFQKQQSIIDAMAEGAEKQREQREFDHKKAIEQIKRNYEDQRQAAFEAARSEWEKKNGNTSKEFTTQDAMTNDTYRRSIQTATSVFGTAMADEMRKYNDVSDLIAQYADYDQKRKAMDEKYEYEHKRIMNAIAAADARAMDQSLSLDDRRTAASTASSLRSTERTMTTQHGKDRAGLAADQLKENPAFMAAMQDIKSVSTDTLNSLIQQLNDAKQALAGLRADELREFADLMRQIEDEQLQRATPFETLTKAQQDLVVAQERLKSARDKLNTSTEKHIKLLAKERPNSAAVKEAEMEMAKAQKEVVEAENDLYKANSKVIKSWNEVREKLDELSQAIHDLGQAIGGEAGEILMLAADTMSFVTNTIDGIKTLATATAETLSTVEKASVILVITQAAIQIFQKLNQVLNKFSAASKNEELVKKQKEINKLTQAVNEYTMALMKANAEEENWFGESSIRGLQHMADQNAQAYQNYFDKLYETQVKYRNKTRNDNNWTNLAGVIGSGFGLLDMTDPMFALTTGKSKGAWLDSMNGSYGDYTKAINNLRIETRSRKKSFLGMGGHDQETADLREWAKQNFNGAELFDAENFINIELAQTIIDSYGDKLQGETQDTLEALIKLKEQYDEYMENLHEYVSEMYQPLVDNATDALMDWLDTGKDALDSFRDYAGETFRSIVQDLMKQIVLKNIVGSFSDDITALYDKYLKGQMSSSSLIAQVSSATADLMTTYEDQLPVLQDMLQNISDTLIESDINIRNAESVSASTGVAANVTQDSINESNGRMAAIQMQGESIIMQTSQSNMYLSSIAEMAALRNAALNDIYSKLGSMQKDMGATLVTIAENTRGI